MKIQIPQSDHPRILLEISGPDFLRRMEVSTELKEIVREYEDVDEAELTIVGQFCDNGRNPVGPELVLKEAEDRRYDDEAGDLFTDNLDETLDEPEDEDDEEAPVEDREEAPVEEADGLVGELDDEVAFDPDELDDEELDDEELDDE
jgi:hypothetical protein